MAIFRRPRRHFRWTSLARGVANSPGWFPSSILLTAKNLRMVVRELAAKGSPCAHRRLGARRYSRALDRRRFCAHPMVCANRKACGLDHSRYVAIHRRLPLFSGLRSLSTRLRRVPATRFFKTKGSQLQSEQEQVQTLEQVSGSARVAKRLACGCGPSELRF